MVSTNVTQEKSTSGPFTKNLLIFFFYSENVSHVGFYSHYFNFYYYNSTHFKTFHKEMFLETI